MNAVQLAWDYILQLSIDTAVGGENLSLNIHLCVEDTHKLQRWRAVGKSSPAIQTLPHISKCEVCFAVVVNPV